ncbi:MAG: hypothetical protein ABDH37_00795, partial [Candidatus Hydrothermales bacterium]
MKKLGAILIGLVSLYGRDTLVYLGSFDPGDRTLKDIWVVGNRAYLTAHGPPFDSSGGIIFLDLTDKTNPREVNYFQLGWAHFIEVHDSLAYVTVYYRRSRLFIINVKDPKNPFIMGSVSVPSPRDIEIVDTICYVASPAGFFVINIKNPRSPFLVSECTVRKSCFFLKFHNGILYVTNQPFYAYLNSFDVTDPSNPIFLDSIRAPKYDPFSYSWIGSLDIYSNYAYCGSDSGLWIVTISDPTNLQRANLLVFDGYALK